MLLYERFSLIRTFRALGSLWYEIAKYFPRYRNTSERRKRLSVRLCDFNSLKELGSLKAEMVRVMELLNRFYLKHGPWNFPGKRSHIISSDDNR